MVKHLCSIFSLMIFSNIGFAQTDIVWEKSIGGEHAEYLYNAIPTPDYGFLILGSSSSNATGDIQKNNQGNLDYFIWKMDENGNEEWQNSFGGEGNDFLYAANPTSDGGYILVGASTSSKSGDKSQVNRGAEDIWVIKIDANGNIQWEKTIGGNGNDIPVDVINTKDGGYIIAANSNSVQDDLKSAEHFGANDYYIIKIDTKGNIQWEKTFGGVFEDKLKSIVLTDNGYLLIGNSNSPMSGNKTIEQNGNAIWINAIDFNGNLVNQHNLNFNTEHKLISFQEKENQFIFSIQEKDQNTRVIFTDENLNKIKDISIETDNKLSLNEIKLKNDQLILVANQIYNSDNKTQSYYITKSFDLQGKENWNKKLGNDGFNYLEKAISTRDGSLILFGNSTQNEKGNNGQSDFYLVKLGEKESTTKKQFIEAYPNPTSDVVNVLINKEFDKATIEVYNIVGQHLQSKEVKYRSTPISLGSYPSGVYMLKISYDNQKESIKIIKK